MSSIRRVHCFLLVFVIASMRRLIISTFWFDTKESSMASAKAGTQTNNLLVFIILTSVFSEMWRCVKYSGILMKKKNAKNEN